MLTLIPSPIGNLEDISLRALKAMSACEVVLCEDTRVTGRLFDLLDSKIAGKLTLKLKAQKKTS